MSLIHDALKKAQDQAPEHAAPLGSGVAAFQEGAASSQPAASRTRTVVLMVALALALGFMGYVKFWPAGKGKAPQGAAAFKATPSSEGTAQPQDLPSLKKGAADAYLADDLQGAMDKLTVASQLDDKDPEIWNNLGLVARKQGDQTRAREAYEKALTLKPEYPEALNNLAVLSLQGGDTEKAKELLEKALAVQPAYPEANFHLALLFEQKGEKARAVEHYKSFLQASGSLPSSVVDQVRDHVAEMER